MDKLIGILNDFAELQDGRPTFELTNTSAVIKVDARTRKGFQDPESAFSAAREFAGALLASGFVAVNRVEIGAKTEPWLEESEWRGQISMCIWPEEDLTDDHEIATGMPR